MDALIQDPARVIAQAVGRPVVAGVRDLLVAVAFVVLPFNQASITTVGVLLGFTFLFAGFEQHQGLQIRAFATALEEATA